MRLLERARREAEQASGLSRLERLIEDLTKKVDRHNRILEGLRENATEMTADSPEAVRDMIYSAFYDAFEAPQR